MSGTTTRATSRCLRGAIALLVAVWGLAAPADSGVATASPALGTSEPAARSGHNAVWTGEAMIVWGGSRRGAGGEAVFAGGDTLDLPRNRWRHMPDPAPEQRAIGPIAWTGRELILWGSGEQTSPGSRFDPSTGVWRKLPALPFTYAYLPREATLVWTGRELIAWGGIVLDSRIVWPGARYDPAKDAWLLLPAEGAPMAGREGHTAVWTGEEMIVWGGSIAGGGRYDPRTNAWRPMSSAGQEPRAGHTATWTGGEMLVWGGEKAGVPLAGGARYDPRTDTWTPMSSTGAPAPAGFHAAAWSGTELLVWTASGAGGRYAPATDTWRPIPAKGAPSPSGHVSAVWAGRFSAVWTGRELVVWGAHGGDDVPSEYGAAYDPSTDTWRPLGIDWLGRRARTMERALRQATVIPVAAGESCLAHGFGKDGRFAYTCTWVPNLDYSDGEETWTWVAGPGGAEERTDAGRIEEKGVELGPLEIFAGPGPWTVGGATLAFAATARLVFDDADAPGSRWATDAWVSGRRGRLRLASLEHHEPPVLRALALVRNPRDGRLAVVAEVRSLSLEASYDRGFVARTFTLADLGRREEKGAFAALADPLRGGPFEAFAEGRVSGAIGFSKSGRFGYVVLRPTGVSGGTEAWLLIVDLVSDELVQESRWDGSTEVLLRNGIVPLDPIDLRASGPRLRYAGASFVGEVRGSDLVVLRSGASGAAGWKRIGAASTPETTIAGWFVSPWEPRAAAVVADGRGVHVVGVHLAKGYAPNAERRR